jgi:archaetidylinositol phosphate synthase
VNRADFFARWSSLHGGAPITGVVKGWLSLSFQFAQLFTRIRLTPNGLTFGGIICAAAAWPLARSWWAVPLVMLALFADGLDGSLAIYSGVDSVRGALIDSFADRVTEAFFFLVFYQIAPTAATALFLAWILSFTQEYIRARAGGLGNKSTGVVTLSERPVRVIFLLVALTSFHVNRTLPEISAYIWLAVQMIAISQLVRYQRQSI